MQFTPLQLKSESLNIITFIGVGGVATLVHLCVAIFFSTTTSINAFLINILAFSCAFPVSFLGHKHVTFKKNGSIFKFFILAFAGFILNTMILTSLYLNTNINPAIMLCLSTLLTPALTYFAAKLWVFQHQA